LPAVARLELFEVRLVVAIEAKVVAIVTSVAHHDVRMFFRNDQIVIVIEPQRWRFAAFVAGVAIEI
jgi:hypothetical protein